MLKFIRKQKKLYERKKYQEAVEKLDAVMASAIENQLLTSNFSYLRAISLGHVQPIDSLVEQLQEIEKRFPYDTLVNVRLKQQLRIIEKNKEWFSLRPFAIMDVDSSMNNNPDFAPKYSPSPISTTVTVATETQRQPTNQSYDFPDSAQYTFIVYLNGEDVNSTVLRAKISQFNRSTYSHKQLKSNIKDIDDTHEIIYVDEIGTLEEAINYYESIIKDLGSLIKPDDDSVFPFVISEQESQKLIDVSSIENYINYFKAHF